jgi:hypothetical protein
VPPSSNGANVTVTTLSAADLDPRQVKLIRSGRSSAMYSPSISWRRSG